MRIGCISSVLAALALCLATGLSSAGEPGHGPVVTVTINGPVDVGRANLLDRACEEAVRLGGAMLLIEVDSPGGSLQDLDFMLASVEKARAAGIRTCCRVFGNAWSAAAILAISCDRLYLGPSSSMGAAQPVLLTGSEMKPAGEKYVSAMRTQARATAERSGRPHLLAQAMVDQDIEVLEIESDGERMLVTAAQWEEISNRAQAEGGNVRKLQVVIEKGKLLSLSANQAGELGMSDGLASTRAEVLDKEGLSGSEVIEMRMDWFQHLANFLALPLVSMLLLVGGVAGIWVELKTPGFGFPGILGACALFLFFFGKYTAGMAEYYEILIFVAGVALLAAEIFVTPGFGLLGASGIALMLAGLFLSSQRFIVPEGPHQWREFQLNVVYTSLSLMGAAGVMAFLATVLPKTPAFRRMTLDAPINATPQTGSAVGKADMALEGVAGIADTILRPSGKGDFGGRIVDVVTEGDWVDAGANIVVLRVEGNRVIVRQGGPREGEA